LVISGKGAYLPAAPWQRASGFSTDSSGNADNKSDPKWFWHLFHQ
jgi:hypothetical protein